MGIMASNSSLALAASHPAGSRYRPDIDGLRAIAVLAVVFYHYAVPGFAGGYVGVDVFFVISGYLITSLIYDEMQQQRFSLLNFYVRRIRRIFPALFVMLAIVSGLAAWLLFPADFDRFAHSLGATALFAVNIQFLGEIGYFKVAAVERPLLHLWSVAVEEQYYLLFPALLLLARTRSRYWLGAIVGGLLLASFGFAQWSVLHEPGWAFYLLPSRMWELMVGALLAITGIQAPRPRVVREGLGLIGLGLIAYAIFTFSKATLFPGTNALFPCIGTALVILAGTGGNGYANRVLSLSPIVFVGLISYSLYLWHWPIFVLARYYLYRAPNPEEVAVCFTLAVTLSILSWHFVEKPLRRMKFAWPRLVPFGAGAVVIAATLLLAVAVIRSNGLPDRFEPSVRRMLAEEHDDDGMLDDCFGLPLKDINQTRLCRFGASAEIQPSFILWGDSHADAILPAVRDVAKQNGREGFFVGEPSCAPLLGVARPDTPRCLAFNDRVMAFVQAHSNLKVVILMARWGKNADGLAYGDEGTGFVPISDQDGKAVKPSDNAAIFTRGLRRTVAALRAMKRDVVLVGPVPEIGWPVPRVLAREEITGKPRRAVPSQVEYLRRQRVVLPLFERLAQADEGISAVYPGRYLCAGEQCAVMENGIPLYRDQHHLSVYGARRLDALFADIF